MMSPDRRSRRLAFVFLGLIFLCLSLVGYLGAMRSVTALSPVWVTVTAMPGAALPELELSALSPYDKPVPVTAEAPGRWRIARAPVRDLKLRLGAGWRERLDAVEVRIGARRYRYGAEDLATQWGHATAGAGGEARLLPWPLLVGEGRLRARLQAVNWPDDSDVALRALAFPVLLAALVAALLLLGERRWRRLLPAAEPSPPVVATGTGPEHLAWPAFGLGVVVSALFLVEAVDPYYFAQDDNLVQFLPVVLKGCQLLNQDIWPDYNPYQLMGTPMASLGIYALSYPLLWLSCAVAGAIIGLETAVFEVYAAIHIGLGYLASYALGRRLGLTTALATTLALSFALCGFFLIAGRSWYYMLPAATWAPVLLLSAVALATTARPFRWVALTGLAIGLFFHAGNAQMWVYGVLTWGLVIGFDWLAGRIAWRRLLWALAAVVFGLGVAAPLLVPQFAFVSRLAREAAAGNGIWNALGALVLPYPLVQAGHPNGWGGGSGLTMSPFYYSGSVLTLAGLAAIAAALAHILRSNPDRHFWAGQRWVILAVLAAWLAIGEAGGLWTWLGQLPVFGHFTHPFKLLPYLVLFLNLAGALALARVLPARGLAPPLVAGVVATLVLLNAGLARNAFGLFADDPYRHLPDEIAKALRPAAQAPSGRVASAMTVPPGGAGYTASLDYNLATRHGVVSADGYGSMVYFSPENRHLLSRLRAEPEASRRAYGIRWLLGAESPTTGRATPIAAVFQAGFEGAVRLAAGDGMVLYDLGAADPMAFFADAPTMPLAVRIEGAEVVVDVPEGEQARRIVLNFLHRPGTVLEAAGAHLDTTADEWGRITAEVAPGVAVLRLGYGGGWGRGLYFGIVLVLMATAIVVVAVARDPSVASRRHAEKESP